VLALFAPEILQVWTRNATTVEQTHLLVSILVIGTALNGLMNLPYALQLAHGWTKLVFYINIAAITLLTPLLFILTSLYGAIGAAVIWCVLNAAYVLVSIQLMHRRLLPGEQWRWYTEDVGQPLLAALAVAGLGRWLLRGQLPLFTTVGSVGIIAGGAFVAAALSVPQIRTWSLRQIKRIQRVSINESI
jgi:O-antigen/teichoic acid export membrane protein